MMYDSVQIIKLILLGIACISLFLFVLNSKNINLVSLTNKTIDKGLKRNSKGYFSYERLDRYLRKMGKEETPTKFILLKIGFSLLFIILSLREQSMGITIVLACIGFILPDYLVKRSNRRDNEDMMPDIRLKEALLILNGKLIRDKDIELAIQDFNDKFDNPHIDSLCAIIKSGLESGKTLQILEDVTEQLEDISEAGFRKEENEIERQVTYLQLMVYVGVIATSFFIFYLELINSVSKF
ncbi:hypothetical protein [Clostridium sp.]|uniref:hypothetical protein n=1 Tax=Clostridium sp. TaxID=1506 RepID=UPI0028FEE848|nr:hypothetical protein [Clostridium sp.]MDU2284220.1 hypothetical protein [Clostridium sp.]